ncbi:hypothetical protein EDD65_10538 [Keratinibaculum paraultunense]|uniref:Homeodomain-like domain-containing protein n=1 Tax=Keratinibaculum paraultunense TaxID=1278232 RepID=A0A4R3KVN4_9FIRM|nr:hypothetical protein [Keratinibaculum paraultunense]QQY78753.1 hypothetical protein JL105_05875 [Keratinibaculum paraultunense]TCS89567.1 hypothetical protein EDD65_10538 [Keratinibaculum paraultunense]
MKNKYKYRKNEKPVDLHDLYELIELGFNKEEISKELGISKKYVQKTIENFYKDY